MAASSEYVAIQKIILEEKNYDKALNLIYSSCLKDSYLYQELLALVFFRLNDFISSAKIYESLRDFYKLGYCNLLNGDVNSAKFIWRKTPSSPAQNWGLFFCELFSDDVSCAPTYLQIRAFLERDLGAFLRLNLDEYVQKIIDVSEFLFEVNPETNKIISRAFLYNDYPQYAKIYLDRAFDFTDEDAELYYLSGVYNNTIGKTEDAKNILKKAIELNENYIPAKLLLEKI